MTIHLDRYDGELWCGRHRGDDGHSADFATITEDADGALDEAERVAEVTCIACLDAAAAFGERCRARRETLMPPRPRMDSAGRAVPIADLIDRGSFGTPGAKAVRAAADPATVARIIERAERLDAIDREHEAVIQSEIAKAIEMFPKRDARDGGGKP